MVDWADSLLTDDSTGNTKKIETQFKIVSEIGRAHLFTVTIGND